MIGTPTKFHVGDRSLKCFCCVLGLVWGGGFGGGGRAQEGESGIIGVELCMCDITGPWWPWQWAPWKQSLREQHQRETAGQKKKKKTFYGSKKKRKKERNPRVKTVGQWRVDQSLNRKDKSFTFLVSHWGIMGQERTLHHGYICLPARLLWPREGSGRFSTAAVL